jgi:hypothetical protein
MDKYNKYLNKNKMGGAILNKEENINFNKFLKENNIQSAIEILLTKIQAPDYTHDIKMKDYIMRIIHNVATNSNQNLDNFLLAKNLFLDLFITQQIFRIEEGDASAVLKLYINGNSNVTEIEIIENYILSQINPITRRILDPLIEFYSGLKNENKCKYLFHIGMSHNIIFNDINYEHFISSLNISGPNTKNILLEMIDYMEKNMLNNITQKTAEILHNVFENKNQFELIDIHKSSGMCSNCNKKLNKFNLDTKEKNDILKYLEDISKSNKNFTKIIEFIKKNPVEYVIDGANVGFQLENNIMTINFNKIDSVLKIIGINSMVFLHSRHFEKISQDNQKLITQWESVGIKICKSPFKFNDDISWMYAALYNDAYLISNDEMRDHYVNIYSKVSPINFKLWKELHQTTHNFDSGSKLDFILTFPPVFLNFINKTENTIHFPVDSRWFCLEL